MMRRLVLALFIPTLMACATEGAGTSGSAPGYKQLHEAIFAPNCANSACHGGELGIGGLSFEGLESSYAALIDIAPTNSLAQKDGLKRVAPGNSEGSFLVRKLAWNSDQLNTHGYGAAMPMASFPAPGPKSLEAIRQWIDAGAPMDGADFEVDEANSEVDNYVSCDGTTEDELRACFPAPAGEDRLRIYTPALHLQPGTEHLFCSRIDIDIEDDLLLSRAKGLQMSGGHHAAVYVSMAASNDFEPIECDQIDMGAMRFVTGAGGAGGQELTVPDGVALRISKGQQIIVQSHYINTTLEPQVVMDAIDLSLVSDDDDLVIADSLAVIDSEFEVPAGAEDYERVKTCTLDQEIDLHLLLGHTHDYGVLFRAELIRAGGATEELYFATDGPTLRDNPAITTYDPPLHLMPGDQLRITCRWTNTTDHALGWPEEMCVAFSYYSPAAGFMICDTFNEHPVLITGEATDGCGQPDDLGNELGIGLYCTADGNECADNGVANFCIAAFSSHNYCTKILCQDDSECGTGAHCATESAGSACVPDYCD